MKENKLIWIFFIGLLLFYISWSPGTMVGMGYTQENVDAANQIITTLGDWLRLRHSSAPVAWQRNGLFDALFEVPFALLSRIFFGTSPEWSNRFASLLPVLSVTLICTLIFVWVRRLTDSLVWAYVLTLMTGLSTMLWPYAYIGLETTQALFLLLSGYLALGLEDRRSWPWVIAFAASCGVAISAKSNSIFLIPAIGFLVWSYFRPADGEQQIDRRKLITVVAIIATCYVLGAYTRSLCPVWVGGSLHYFRKSMVSEPLEVIFNVLNFFTSVNKGLLIYCPIIILCLFALKKAYALQPRIIIFASVTLIGLVAGFAPLHLWSEETWGPRYLLSVIAPLIICFAANKQGVRFRWRKELPLIGLAVLGTFIAFLGSFFYYGLMPGAAGQVGQNTLEAYHSDVNWNHIQFNWKLLSVWARRVPQGVETWPPPPHWWFVKPPDAVPLKSIDLREFVIPQPKLIRGWEIDLQGGDRFVWIFGMFCLPVSIFLLAWLGYLVRKIEIYNRLNDLQKSGEFSRVDSST